MARIKLSEYRSKNLLMPEYRGVALHVDSLDVDITNLDKDTKYVVKVDQGVKKRGKQGLLKLDVQSSDVKQAVLELHERGFARFIAEQMLDHDKDEEHYISFERVREGVTVNYSTQGGIDVEDHAESIQSFTLPKDAERIPVDLKFVEQVVAIMNQQHLSFVEINPLVVRGTDYHLLDAAVLADSAGIHTATWDEEDIVQAESQHPAELAIKTLQASSPASFSLRVLDPNGALWLLLSGGGASITLADEAANHGRADAIGNYGEYSGGPTTQETYLYTRQVLACLLESTAPRKALIIAGGVANFTDVRKTFSGIIQALSEVLVDLQDMDIKVFVRRGGPHEAEGLQMMKEFLENHGLLGSIHGSSEVLTTVINEALEYIDA